MAGINFKYKMSDTAEERKDRIQREVIQNALLRAKHRPMGVLGQGGPMRNEAGLSYNLPQFEDRGLLADLYDAPDMSPAMVNQILASQNEIRDRQTKEWVQQGLLSGDLSSKNAYAKLLTTDLGSGAMSGLVGLSNAEARPTSPIGKSAREVELAQKISSGMATPTEKAEWDMYQSNSKGSIKTIDEPLDHGEFQRYIVEKGEKKPFGKPYKGVQSRHEDRMELGWAKYNLSNNKYLQSLDKNTRDATLVMRDKANEELKPFADLQGAIDQGYRGLRTGAIGAKQLKSALALLSNNKVRALAELEQYNGYGTLPQRIGDTISRFLSGENSDSVKAEAKALLDEVQREILDKSAPKHAQWRNMAKQMGLNPHFVVPYKSKDDVFESFENGELNEDQLTVILREFK